MIDSDPIYKMFLAALEHETSKNWKRQKSTLAIEAGITPSALTDILKQNTKAKFVTRAALAKACGYSYEAFLELGENLLCGKSPYKKKGESDQISDKTNTSKPIPIDTAVQLLQEALEETGVKINQKQKESVIKILREEIKKAEADTKEDIKKYLKAFSG